MKLKTITTACALAVAGVSSLGSAQEMVKAVPTKPILVASTSQPPASACEKKDVTIFLDATGSFVDYLLHKDVFNGSIRRIKRTFRVCVSAPRSKQRSLATHTLG